MYRTVKGDRRGEALVRVIEGGRPRAGETVLVDGQRATVVAATFSTHVFRDDISVRYENGNLDLVPLEKVERSGVEQVP